MLETAGKSLHHSCWSELTRQGISLPLDRYSYGRRLLGFRPFASNNRSFTCQHRAGVRLYTSSYDLAESCVFDKQSLPSFQLHLDLVTQSRLCFSRSYTYNLPSSFSTIISYTLVYSTQPPVLVFGTIKISKLFPVNVWSANVNPIRHKHISC